MQLICHALTGALRMECLSTLCSGREANAKSVMSLGIGHGLKSNRNKIAETAEKQCHVILVGWFHWLLSRHLQGWSTVMWVSYIKHHLQKNPRLILKTWIRHSERSSIWKKPYYENSWNGFMHQSQTLGATLRAVCLWDAWRTARIPYRERKKWYQKHYKIHATWLTSGYIETLR